MRPAKVIVADQACSVDKARRSNVARGQEHVRLRRLLRGRDPSPTINWLLPPANGKPPADAHRRPSPAITGRLSDGAGTESEAGVATRSSVVSVRARAHRCYNCVMTRRDLLEAALALPPDERAELAADLLATLAGPTGIPSLDDAKLVEELDRRSDAANAHPETLVPADEAFAHVRASLQQKRK
jgi:putative addiction module component (TIGR02574 family)